MSKVHPIFKPILEDIFRQSVPRTAKIRTEYIHPPIPFRGCDWIAWIDEDQWAYGETEAVAIENLAQKGECEQ